MAALRLIMGDQLSRSLSALRGLDSDGDFVLMVEVEDEITYVKHHRQKIVLVLAAMRHFAQALTDEGVTVDYVRLDDEDNSGSFTGEIERALKRHEVDEIIVTRPGEWRVWEMVRSWQQKFELSVEIRGDDRFLCSVAEFADWADGRKALRMEHFYRQMRRKTGMLMENGKPAGGKWNYDAENREALPDDARPPRRRRFKPDRVTREVIALIEERCPDHVGEMEPFGWAVIRADALTALEHFIEDCLPDFGSYQDAMKAGEDLLYHALISPYLNLGLLLPLEVCEAALEAYEQDAAPLAAVEGFVRQILGWREYVRGIYWTQMPEYAETNYLEARRALPDFYWTGETELNCLREVIGSTLRNAYAHHIQRLMITGNFALLAGLDPAAVNEWYLMVYADAFEWVELPNTHGMALHADGGVLGSKPYAASGAYIDRMSDYCRGCRYDPKVKLGPEACPFNYLYWNFLIENQDRLADRPRMAMAYRTLERMSSERRDRIVADASAFLDRL